MARHTHDLSRRLEVAPEDVDWALTLLFYAAMHLVQAYAVEFCDQNLRHFVPRSHSDRERFVALHLPAALFTPYKRLYSGSMRARYELYLPTLEELHRYWDLAFEPLRGELQQRGFSL